MFEKPYVHRIYGKISEKTPENLKKVIIPIVYSIFEKFYDLLGLKWYSCDFMGIQCRTCKRIKICNEMFEIYLMIVWF